MASQLSRRRLLGVATLTVLLLGAALVSSFPARSIMAQRHETEVRQARLERVETEIGRLELRLARLQDADEIARLSREKYGYVPPGWESYNLVTPEIDDVRLPDGWPLLLVTP